MRPSVLFEMQPNKDNSALAASLVIPTYNRRTELRELLSSAQKQTVPLEIIIMDDGSTDGTEQMMSSEFPDVAFHQQTVSKGPAYLRNRGIERASCNIVFSLDDDSLFVSPLTVEQTLAEFDHPRVGAVGMPHVNIREETLVRQRSATPGEISVAHAFVGAAHAVRRDVFLKLGGYREHFFYMGEEGDYCLRMLNFGYVTRLGNADPVHHLESPRRHTPLADRCGRRNDILFAWHNVPSAWLPFHLAMTTINGFRSGVEAGNVLGMLAGTISGYAQVWPLRHERQPVSPPVFRLHRRLKKRGPLRLEDIERDLPALPCTKASNVDAARALP